jgi:hypothetical protein
MKSRDWWAQHEGLVGLRAHTGVNIKKYPVRNI